jgi:hypothetical protein
MSASKRLRVPLIVLFSVIMGVLTFAGPANAANPVYPPPAGIQVLGSSASSNVPSVSATNGGLAFTGANAIGIGALGGLLLVGGGALVVAGRRRKVNA